MDTNIVNGTDVTLDINGKRIKACFNLDIRHNGKEKTYILEGFLSENDEIITIPKEFNFLNQYFDLFKIGLFADLKYKKNFVFTKKVKLMELDFSFAVEESSKFKMTFIEI
jgi:hypothetical protein